VRLTFLGTGTSFGVPQVGCGCAVCRSTDPRDRRTRTGAVIETDGGTRLLVDTPPELRLQLVAAGIDRVDAVLYTHDHADHVHGLDDLRAVSVRRAGALPVYGSADTLDRIARKFAYVFDATMRPLPGTTKPEGALHALTPGEATRIGDAEVVAVPVPHGRDVVFGYRVGPVAYVTDAKAVPADALALLAGVRVLVINALFWSPHPTHLSIPEAIETARAIGAERTYLTHLTHDNPHARLAERLPPGVEPAYDGLVVTV
jgi:phosphoribosyl 1,2-cyclic phosphate phosphodiesterase